MAFSGTKKAIGLSEFLWIPIALLILVLVYIFLGIFAGGILSSYTNPPSSQNSEGLVYSYPSYVLKTFLLMPLNEDEREELNEEEKELLRGKAIIRVQDLLQVNTKKPELYEELRKRYIDEINEERLEGSTRNFVFYTKLVGRNFETQAESYPKDLLHLEYEGPQKNLRSLSKEKNAFYVLRTSKGELFTLYFARPGSFDEVSLS